MFTRKETVESLKGCSEICLFMSRGISRFPTGAGAAVKSFLIPIILAPIVLAILIGVSSGFSFNYLLALHSARVVLTSALFLAVVYFMSKQYGREEHFFRFVTVNNWMTIPSTLLLLPIMGGLVMGYDYALFETYALFVTILGYIFIGFIVTNSFRLPWEMGGFIAILGMAIEQHGLDLAAAMTGAFA